MTTNLINQRNFFSLTALVIYLTFGLDSLLKVDVGVQLHFGLLSILVIVASYVITSPRRLFAPLRHDPLYPLFIAYCIINGFIFAQPAHKMVSAYLVVSLCVFVYIYNVRSHFSHGFFKLFQVTLIVSGLIQYLAYKVFGHQISFIDADYYTASSSISSRLRGFFIEPNWYSVAIIFNTLLLYGNTPFQYARRHPFITICTLVVIVLNGSFAGVGLLAFVYSVPIFKKSIVKGSLVALLLFVTIFSTFSFREVISQKGAGESLFNHSSRIVPLIKVIELQARSDITNIVFGHGFGAWATISERHSLSALNIELTEATRDSSELHLFILELGVFGLVLLVFDLAWAYYKCPKEKFHIRGGIIIFFVFLALYPTLKFWMYMPYYFYIRSEIFYNTRGNS
ncbi:hypothetical protein [Pseudomonas saudiphocaensis]|uniref:hypothetical protein n=1 Tax=Pseudomonas saudiphocaensis TaxID=1499686 RepID=UPI000F77F3D6|nr:hypothetical protein [Pseudomonas saudiphocaensis]